MKRTVSLREVEEVLELEQLKKITKALVQRDTKTAIESFCTELITKQSAIREKKAYDSHNVKLHSFTFEIRYNSKTGPKLPLYVCEELNTLCRVCAFLPPSLLNIRKCISDVFFPSFIVTKILSDDHKVENRLVHKSRSTNYEDILFHKFHITMSSVEDARGSWRKSIKRVINLTHLLITNKTAKGTQYTAILFLILDTIISRLPFLKQYHKHGVFTTRGFLDAIIVRFPVLTKEPFEHRDYRITELLNTALKEIVHANK